MLNFEFLEKSLRIVFSPHFLNLLFLSVLRNTDLLKRKFVN